MDQAVPVASRLETVQFGLKVALPAFACGAVKRRRAPMALAERFQTDRAAVRLLVRLRERHGPGPLRLRVPGRSVAVVLAAEDAARLLEDSPDPFTPDTPEKHAALGKFQPHGVLISHGTRRAARRDFNEAVLDTHRPLHHLAPALLPGLNGEIDRLTAAVEARGELDWRRFDQAWQRAVRGLVFGDAARDDRELTAALDSLRRSGNWSRLGRRRTRAREAFAARLRRAVDEAGPDTLAAAVRDDAADASIHPEDQIAHWLFAFDATGIAGARTLALLAVHPGHRLAALNELAAEDPSEPAELPFLRACVLETVRLWPTTPLILRDSTAETRWGAGALPADTSFVLYAPLFHRDPERPYADRFSPDIWLDGTAHEDPSLVPFSGGPARCPGRNIALFCATSALARLLREREWRLASPSPLYPGGPVPATLDHCSLAFRPEPARQPLLDSPPRNSAPKNSAPETGAHETGAAQKPAAEQHAADDVPHSRVSHGGDAHTSAASG
jgi:cytochrome P450